MATSVGKASKKVIKKVAKKSVKTASSKKAKSKHQGKTDHIVLAPSIRQKMIEEAAYYHAQQRNFAPGNAVADWLLAEKEIDKIL